MYIYPIKACAAIPVGLDHHRDDNGLQHDREFCVERDSDVLTQREHPRLALVQPRLDGDQIVVSAPGFGECSNDHGEWFSRFLGLEGSPCKLVRRPHSHDSAPFSVITRPDLEALSESAGYPLHPLRFRPNFVVGDVAELVTAGIISSTSLAVRNLWGASCLATTKIDPETAIVHPNQPEHAIRDQGGYFGFKIYSPSAVREPLADWSALQSARPVAVDCRTNADVSNVPAGKRARSEAVMEEAGVTSSCPSLEGRTVA